MDLGLRDRVYLVTGGSRGLGFAAAQALVADGARVLLSAPHEATASSAAARLAPDAAADVAAWVVADNADPATPGRLIAAARDRFGRLDGALISVGGSPPTGSVSLMPSAAIPIRNVPASPRASRCAGTASPRSSDELPRSCSPRPHPSSRARGSR